MLRVDQISYSVLGTTGTARQEAAFSSGKKGRQAEARKGKGRHRGSSDWARAARQWGADWGTQRCPRGALREVLNPIALRCLCRSLSLGSIPAVSPEWKQEHVEAVTALTSQPIGFARWCWLFAGI